MLLGLRSPRSKWSGPCRIWVLSLSSPLVGVGTTLHCLNRKNGGLESGRAAPRAAQGMRRYMCLLCLDKNGIPHQELIDRDRIILVRSPGCGTLCPRGMNCTLQQLWSGTLWASRHQYWKIRSRRFFMTETKDAGRVPRSNFSEIVATVVSYLFCFVPWGTINTTGFKE